MKTIKRLIVLLVCFVLLSNCLSMNVAAEEYEDYLYTADDLIDMGAQQLSDGSYFLSDEFQFPSFYASSEKYFPSFDINQVNWSVMPKYIQDIVYMGISDVSKDYVSVSSAKVPFVMVSVYNSTYFRIYVGLNVGLGRLNDANGSVGIYTLLPTTDFISDKNTAYNNSCLYSALFNLSDYSISSDWALIPQNRFDTINSGDISYPFVYRYFTYNIFNLMSGNDMYLYGANYVTSVGTASGTYSFPLNNSSSQLVSFYMSRDGFSSGTYIFNQAQYDAYFQTFMPKTSEQYSQELQEGTNHILGQSFLQIIELPSKIANAIKGFFTSLGDRISGFFENLKNYLLYFQENKPEHVNPFAGILDGIQSFFDEQIADTDDFKSSLDTTFDNISGYIQTGSNVINRLLTGVPILNTVVVFLLAFAVIRKVVGR